MTIISSECSAVLFCVYMISTDYSIIISLSAVNLLKLLLKDVSLSV